MNGPSGYDGHVGWHSKTMLVNRRRCLAVWFFLASLAGGAPRAHAHASFSPSLNNRYLKISLTGNGAIRLAYAVLYGEAPSVPVRRQADADGSGALDERE